MTHTDVAPTAVSSDASEMALRLLDQDVIELFADVDAILCAALRPRDAPGIPGHRVRLRPAPVGRPVLRWLRPPPPRA
jgi:hypothetical protein